MPRSRELSKKAVALGTPRPHAWQVDYVETVFTATVSREGALYVAQCCEIDLASQGSTVVEALNNLKEALELFFEGEANAPAGAIHVQAA